MLLDFSLSTLVTDSLGILTSLINFIQSNVLLIGLIGLSIVLSVVFAIVNRLRG